MMGDTRPGRRAGAVSRVPAEGDAQALALRPESVAQLVTEEQL
ncbi:MULTISPECIES: hypothetical protein [Streptomyces]|uniref:Uncharacterized protein n=1 Tax=Streptomyces glycanivorans TaxID=3033808 RepID=A0ABY9JDX2_9ACTN|nr:MULTISPECIES: hypothetical protein [unclassified Streptomyces]WSQ77954.1 hypothetical protein OG725_12930 [Streptomyces sp. NBC_01213]WLQ64573.1 hypothetical protein P8A20_13650 [Streptomyces sp. Alt3]WSQ85327.1 hypothetical protein OG722_13600 [Streptomyces sp. NBC_01212]WSR08581.1 hypothetical protein OG265_22415 [Streptomyces sp. NBC_01208]WSR48670.1 hypothetical protein OG279_13980 [Streptomyces sp. NBC_01201]